MYKKVIFLCLSFLLIPLFAFAIEENCYGNKALSAKENDYYKLANGFCVYPEKTDYPAKSESDKNFPFLGYGAYEWDVYGVDLYRNVSILDFMKGCGEETSPCYCDSSIKVDNIKFKDYCCPKISSSCTRDKTIAYEDRPFYTVYRNNGDIDVKGNLAISGDSSYFLSNYTSIGFISSLQNAYISLKQKFHDVVIKGSISIANNLIFNNKHGSLALSDSTEISKVKKNKIIKSSLKGEKQGNTWSEIGASELALSEFQNLSAIASDASNYYIIDNGNKKVIKVKDDGSVLPLGNDDWAWRPVGIDVDDQERLYVTSTYDEFSEVDNSIFRITSPVSNTVYKAGDDIIVSWSKLPKAIDYKIYYTLNDGEVVEVELNDDKNSFKIEATSTNVGVYTLLLSAKVNEKEIFTNNTCIFSVINSNNEVFRITSPNYASNFTIGDDVLLSWDEYSEANDYRLLYSVNGGGNLEISAGNKTSIEVKASSGSFNVGDYKIKARAYKDGSLLKETPNEIIFSVNQDEVKIKPLSDNIFTFKIEKDINGEVVASGWNYFIPSQIEFKKTKNYEILKEYLEYINNDSDALYLKNPTGVEYYNNFIYIVDSGNNRVVRLSKDLTISDTLATNLKAVKNTYGDGWQNHVDASTRTQANDYWQVVYGEGSIGSDLVYEVDNKYTPLGDLNNPQGIFIDGYIYITDTGNKRVVFQSIASNLNTENWYEMVASSWTPVGVLKQSKYLYISDVEKGAIVRINIENPASDTHSYFSGSQGLIFNNTYFIFGRRGQESNEFNYPVDLTYKDGLFYIIDGVSDAGYSLNASASKVSLYSGEASRKLEVFTKNPYANEFNENTLADKIKIDDSISLFNNQYDELRKWKKGPGISHCQFKCSQGYVETTTVDDCATPVVKTWSHTCNDCTKFDTNPDCVSGCTDEGYDAPMVRTCRDQWDWEANAPTCDIYNTEWNITGVTSSCKMCDATCYTTCEPDDEECVVTPFSCPYPCGTEYTASPACVATAYDCHVGNAVGFEDYTTKSYFPYATLEQYINSQENLDFSLKRGWPDYSEWPSGTTSTTGSSGTTSTTGSSGTTSTTGSSGTTSTAGSSGTIVPADYLSETPNDRMIGDGYISLTVSKKYGGAVTSIIWNNKEFIDKYDFGRELQTAITIDYMGEGYNPTEGGGAYDVNQSTSIMESLHVRNDNKALITTTNMAYWTGNNDICYPEETYCTLIGSPYPCPMTPLYSNNLSGYKFTKEIIIKESSSDGAVLEYITSLNVPDDDGVTTAYGQDPQRIVFEIITGYMPSSFKYFYTYDGNSGLTFLEDYITAPGIGIGMPYITGPVVILNSSQEGLGIYSKNIEDNDSGGSKYYSYNYHGYNGGSFSSDSTAKLNAIFEKTVLINGKLDNKNHEFTSYVIIGKDYYIASKMEEYSNY